MSKKSVKTKSLVGSVGVITVVAEAAVASWNLWWGPLKGLRNMFGKKKKTKTIYQLQSCDGNPIHPDVIKKFRDDLQDPSNNGVVANLHVNIIKVEFDSGIRIAPLPPAPETEGDKDV